MYLYFLILIKPGLYSVRRSTQTQLRKRVYANTHVMWFILLYARIYAHTQ